MRGEAVKISENWINSWGKLFLGDYRVCGWVEGKKYMGDMILQKTFKGNYLNGIRKKM